MQTFLVGGAVRDELLGFPVKERDWVVVGETPETLLGKGFKPVGKDFPVYLHPETREEYALARTERKTAPGYRGFSVQASPGVTLEQDLLRRDLTINAIARDQRGQLIDPYQGQVDLELRLLRHVSDAFCEDPVRILRVARFAARYSHIGFRVAEETKDLMKSMVVSGEVDALVPERVWAEFVRSLGEMTPVAFIGVLRECGAFERLFPELEKLFGVPLSGEWSIETDAGRNALLALENAARITECSRIRFTCLVHDLGRGEVNHPDLFRDQDSVEAGWIVLSRLCDRLKVPGEYRVLAEKVIRCHALCHDIFTLSAEEILALLHLLKGLRKESNLRPFLVACEALNLGQKDRGTGRAAAGEFLLKCQTIAQSVSVQSILTEGFRAAEVGFQLERARILALKKFMDQCPQQDVRDCIEGKP